MSQIFSEAAVTISAASARSVQDGFLEPRKPLPDPPLRLALKTEEGISGSVFMEQPRHYTPEDDPISLRAWTLQEHILSQRLIIYSSRELWWSCRKAWLQDGGISGANTEIAFSRPYFQPGEHFSLENWRSILRDYTRRFLTYSSDKLPAIGGVAFDYARISGSNYLAGLWENSFTSELLWSSRRSDISRPPVKRAPSWSWAAVDGEISHDWCPLDHAGILGIITCQVPPISDSSPFGTVDLTKSQLKVEGALGRFCWTKDKRYIYVWENLGSSTDVLYRK
jgi:hypothetical protein